VPTPKTAPLSHPRPLSQSPHVNRRRGLLLSLPTLLALLVALAAGPAQAASAPASLTLESAVGRSAPLTSVLVGSQPLRTGITPRVAAHLYDRIAVATGVAAKAGAEVGTDLVVRNPLSQHAIERMAERGITRGQVDAAIRKGTQYYDRRNGTISHVLEGGFASGKSLLVGTNPSTGLVTTVIAPRRFNPLVQFNGSRRFVPIP
jgi:uncharacterized protein DUF4258